MGDQTIRVTVPDWRSAGGHSTTDAAIHVEHIAAIRPSDQLNVRGCYIVLTCGEKIYTVEREYDVITRWEKALRGDA